MNGFTEIYGENDRQNAAKAVKNSLVAYCLTALGFAAVSVGFVVLYINVNFLLWLCAILNFVITVAFFWFTVLFFYAAFPEKLERFRFFKQSDGALISRVDGTFVGVGETVTVTKVKYAELLFDVTGETQTLYVLHDAPVSFTAGKKYEIKKIGDRVTAFREAKNV